MPLQNRIDPWGNLSAINARGEFLGNRGILHDKEKNIVRPWKHKKWVTCELSFKGIRRELFGNGYSELFFLDEVTALTAGHKPCAHCRRSRYKEFKYFWCLATSLPESSSVSSEKIDSQLHLERVSSTRTKVLFRKNFGEVPDGTIIALGEEAYLVWGGSLHKWSHHGYVSTLPLPPKNESVQVITPKTIVQMYQVGFKPLVHTSMRG